MASSMEVQTTTSKESETVLASSGSSGSVSVALHPLVIMNISEHYTRIKAQYGEPNPQGDLFCLLLGIFSRKPSWFVTVFRLRQHTCYLSFNVNLLQCITSYFYSNVVSLYSDLFNDYHLIFSSDRSTARDPRWP